jgi:hypothetical protein
MKRRHTLYEDDPRVERAVVTDPTGMPLIRWGAIFGGAVLGFGLLMLASMLWLSLAFGSTMTAVRDNLAWYLGISAIVALFIGGVLTGHLSGVRGAGTGFLHGLTLWALILIVAISVGIPSLLNVFSLGRVATQVAGPATRTTFGDTALWASFWSVLGGFLAAGIGGAIGGAVSRGRRARTSAMTAGTRRAEDVPARRDRDDDTVVVDGETAEHRRVS